MSTSVFSQEMNVHPVAALFPMMSDEELDELAADIKANGQIHSIVLDKNGRVLIDGRNRLEACRRASIEPRFEKLANGVDPVLFILSQNINRRHLNKGQRAILVAECMIQVESKPSQREQAGAANLNQSDLAKAAVILKYAPDQAVSIKAENGKFDPAYQIAKQRKETRERTEANAARLQTEDPALWAQVQDENDPMTLDAAIVELNRRQRAAEEQKLEETRIREQQRMLSTQHLETIVEFAFPANRTPAEKAERFLSLYDRKHAQIDISSQALSSCAEVLNILALKWRSQDEQNTKI